MSDNLTAQGACLCAGKEFYLCVEALAVTLGKATSNMAAPFPGLLLDFGLLKQTWRLAVHREATRVIIQLQSQRVAVAAKEIFDGCAHANAKHTFQSLLVCGRVCLW